MRHISAIYLAIPPNFDDFRRIAHDLSFSIVLLYKSGTSLGSQRRGIQSHIIKDAPTCFRSKY